MSKSQTEIQYQGHSKIDQKCQAMLRSFMQKNVKLTKRF